MRPLLSLTHSGHSAVWRLGRTASAHIGALTGSSAPGTCLIIEPIDYVRARAPISVDVEPDGDDSCIVTVGSSSAAAVARYLAWWEAPFEVLDSPELLEEVRLLAQRYTEASRSA